MTAEILRLIDIASRDWPSPSWPHWVRYGGQDEGGKLTCAEAGPMPESCRHLLGWLATYPPDVPKAIPDLSLYAGGMHAMLPGAHLGVHLDADRHPRFGLQRVANSVLFVGEWQEEWGGALEFWNPGEAEPHRRVFPHPGRLVTFAATDVSLHSVAEVKCPVGVMRKTLMLCWYGPPREESKRPRALFVPKPGEMQDAATEAMRRGRAGLSDG